MTANDEVADALRERLNQRQVLQDINACFEYLNANLAEDTTLEQLTRMLMRWSDSGWGAPRPFKQQPNDDDRKAAVAVNPEHSRPCYYQRIVLPVVGQHVPEQTEL
ncbi:MAG: hypothetical protein R3B74_02095 [Nitrospirales bacterium]|nr:hypothetical protein [Nitrospirales bacterium]